MRRERKTALVTGASSGLGIAIAWELARRGFDLILTARSEEPMRDLQKQLVEETGISVAVEPLDLARPGAAQELVARLDERGSKPAILINNAGFGLSEPFLQHDAGRLRELLQLNVVSLTELTHLLGARMAARGSGHILLVASMAAYAPSPMLAAYAASKAYVLSLGEALHVELAPRVGVTVLSPGLMDTGFNAAAGYKMNAITRRLVRPTSMVAKVGIDALFAGKPSVVAGRLNQFILFVGRLLPRRFALRQLRRRTGRKN